MKKLAIPLSILAMASLGACMTYEPARPANTFTSAAIVSQPVPYYTGTGYIANVTPSPSYSPAAAGGTIPGARPGYPYSRLTVRMDNGAVQYIDTDSAGFARGQRIEVLPDRTIRPI